MLRVLDLGPQRQVGALRRQAECCRRKLSKETALYMIQKGQMVLEGAYAAIKGTEIAGVQVGTYLVDICLKFVEITGT